MIRKRKARIMRQYAQVLAISARCAEGRSPKFGYVFKYVGKARFVAFHVR
jgi:hypothetical protein